MGVTYRVSVSPPLTFVQDKTAKAEEEAALLEE